MRRHSLTRFFVISLTVLFAIGAVAVAQESGATQPKKKKPTLTPEPATQTAPSTQTQTAPSTGKKSSAAKDPKDAGWVTVHGRLMAVQAEQKAVIIQTDTKQYQIHITAQTQITRDGRPAELNALRPNDRVDGCHFNAKHVAQTLKVTSAENVLTARPNPSNQ